MHSEEGFPKERFILLPSKHFLIYKQERSSSEFVKSWELFSAIKSLFIDNFNC